MAVIGCNPSTADAVETDQTVRKDIGFGRRLGWGKLIKVNIFALRTTEIAGLGRVADPVGSENDDYLRAAMLEADAVVAAWGRREKLPKLHRGRPDEVVALAAETRCRLSCFGTTCDGSPRHTERISFGLKPRPWSPGLQAPRP